MHFHYIIQGAVLLRHQSNYTLHNFGLYLSLQYNYRTYNL